MDDLVFFKLTIISFFEQMLVLLFYDTSFLPEALPLSLLLLVKILFLLLLVIQITGGEAVTTGAWGDAIAGDWAIKNGGESGGIWVYINHPWIRRCDVRYLTGYQGNIGRGVDVDVWCLNRWSKWPWFMSYLKTVQSSVWMCHPWRST